MRFSVIMPVYLQPYEVDGIKSAKDPQHKFTRAVDSFLCQTFTDAELIIISDGCMVAENMWAFNYASEDRIKFRKIEKQPLFGGKVRQTGLNIAEGEIICYLDHDDFIGIDHLKIINDNFDTRNYAWAFYNDYLIQGKNGVSLQFIEREVRPTLFYIGTSMIAHRRNVNVQWGDGYAHDWRMIESCLLPFAGIKIPTPQYYVCHFHPKDY